MSQQPHLARIRGSLSPLAFSADAPTAPYGALQNMFVAATRKSALDPSYPPNNPHFARPLAEAIGHALVHGEESLLNARVLRTVVAGRTEYLA
ncbi:MAG: amidohydrolase [Pseudarthrobacter sp.]|nr:amidohydrolase [Pseudarthrobacter sp.]